MNEGNYPDKVVNEAVKLLNKGENPKDVADVLRLKYHYEGLHAKTVARWHRKYPVGKSPKSLPPGFVDKMREVVQGLDQEERKRPCMGHVFFKDSVKEVFSVTTAAPSRTDKLIETQTCRLCGFEKLRRTFFSIT